MSGAWPHFVIEAHHCRFADDCVYLGEELVRGAEAPVLEEPIEGAAQPQAVHEGQGDVAPEQQVGAEAEVQTQAGEDGAELAGEDIDDPSGGWEALDFDGVGPPECKLTTYR